MADVNDTLATERTHLANERTLLAYIRTGLTMIATGAALPRLLAPSPGLVGFSWVLAASGAVGILFGAYRFFEMKRQIDRSMAG